MFLGNTNQFPVALPTFGRQPEVGGVQVFVGGGQ